MQSQHDVLSGLGDKLGLKLSFGDNGKCCLLLDQTLIISIETKPSGWLFIGLVQNSIEWRQKSFWQRLLALNLSLAEQHAGALAYEPVSDALLYTHRLPIAQLNIENAHALLENFTSQLEQLIKSLGN